MERYGFYEAFVRLLNDSGIFKCINGSEVGDIPLSYLYGISIVRKWTKHSKR